MSAWDEPDVERIVHRLSTLDLRVVAVILFGMLVVVGLVGVLVLRLDPGNPWLDLDAEIGLTWPPDRITLAFPAIWSAVTLAFAGLAWLTVGWSRALDKTGLAAYVLGSLLAGFAFDELFKVHERLEGRTGLDWELIYVPVAAVAAVAVATLMSRLRHRGRGITPMLGAAVLCWAVAAALEYVQWRGDEEVELYDLFMVPEELLELAGSALFVLAALATLKSITAQRLVRQV